MQTEATDWIEWSGGENGMPPVAERTLVKVKLRHEAATLQEIDADEDDVGEAGGIDWSHNGAEEGWEVIAYRVVSQ